MNRENERITTDASLYLLSVIEVLVTGIDELASGWHRTTNISVTKNSYLSSFAVTYLTYGMLLKC